MHTDKTLFSWQSSWGIVANVYLLFLILLSGCATTQLTAEDKSQLGRIGIVRAYEKPIVEFAGVPSAAEGAAQGVIGGILFFPGWIIGGPFTAGPYRANLLGRCGRQFDDIKNPDQQFEAVVNAMRVDESLLKYLADRIESAGLGKPAVLESPLKRLDDGSLNLASIADQRFDTVLLIERFRVGLAASYPASQPENIPCVPEVSAEIVWHFVRVRDGKQIVTGSASRSEIFRHPFPAIFQDAALRQSIFHELLEKVANGAMCNSGTDTNHCLRAR